MNNKSKFKKSVSIVLPAFNEQDNISYFLKVLLKNLKKIDYEIIIVNDFSSDNTLKIAETFSKKNKKIKIINNKKNLGFGGSFKEGVKFSKKENIIVLPGDGETNPKRIFQEFRNLKENKILIFSWKNQKKKNFKKGFIIFIH